MMSQKRKAQITSVVTLFIIIFALAVTIVIGKFILDSFYLAMDDAGMTTVTSNNTKIMMQANFLTFDYALVALTVIMIIGLMVTSFLIPTHPIFLVINIIGIFILVFLGMVLTNTYGEIVAGAGAEYLSDTAGQFTKINFLMSYLPYFGAVAITITSLVMFARGVG